ncbi:MAG TPA: OmpA family protein [Chitinophagales bacterium]|nr:OmpA family protein [Chitinophagales bacterium]
MTAQDGTCFISGRVIDQDTRELIPNATIFLNKIEMGVSDSPGHFLITGIYAGKYQLSVRAARYLKKSPDSIIIEMNSTNSFDIFLKKRPSCGPRLKNIYFDSHSFILRPESWGIIDTLAKILKESEEEEDDFMIIEILGQSDTWECKPKDTTLSYQRAWAVAKVLIADGIDSSKIMMRAYGGTHPIAPNSIKWRKNEEGCQLNRRVEFRIKSSIPH